MHHLLKDIFIQTERLKIGLIMFAVCLFFSYFQYYNRVQKENAGM